MIHVPRPSDDWSFGFSVGSHLEATGRLLQWEQRTTITEPGITSLKSNLSAKDITGAYPRRQEFRRDRRTYPESRVKLYGLFCISIVSWNFVPENIFPWENNCVFRSYFIFDHGVFCDGERINLMYLSESLIWVLWTDRFLKYPPTFHDYLHNHLIFLNDSFVIS